MQTNNTFQFLLKEFQSSEKAEEQLASMGCQVLWTEEAPGHTVIIATCPEPNPSSPSTVEKVTPYLMAEASWERQWAEHAPNFDGNVAAVPLSNGKCVRLYPGAGFGDCSHATTQMMLELQAGRVGGKLVLDVGSGSGILSIAAALQGAASVLGIDIDAEAIAHANENLSLNPEVAQQIQFMLPATDSTGGYQVALMNMISSEQQQALAGLQATLEKCPVWICSGILSSEKEEYLDLWTTRGYRCQKILEEDNWMAFCFERKEKCPE